MPPAMREVDYFDFADGSEVRGNYSEDGNPGRNPPGHQMNQTHPGSDYSAVFCLNCDSSDFFDFADFP